MVDAQCWPVCQKCQTVCVRYLAPRVGWAWRQDCRCRKTYYAIEGAPNDEPFTVYPATAGVGAVVVLTLALILVTACGALVIWRYESLRAEVREACAQTSAAGKLDISSFVPLCEKVKP